jgi:uncharacterized protein YjbI with pentapeptide repeats
MTQQKHNSSRPKRPAVVKSAQQQVNGQEKTQLPRPTTEEEWSAHWQAQNQPWRTESEISQERQEELAKRRDIKPDLEKGIYPFGGMKLERADVEWLLATHDRGQGPVDWNDEKDREREGLDLRGADLRDVNLCNLPLARMNCGSKVRFYFLGIEEQHALAEEVIANTDLDFENIYLKMKWPLEKIYPHGAHFEGANLEEAHLEGAVLNGVHLEGARLFGARLEMAYLIGAYLEGAILTGAHLEGANLEKAHLEGAILVGSHFEGADLYNVHLSGAYLRLTHFEGVILYGAHLEGKKVVFRDLERIRKWKKEFPGNLPPAYLSSVFFDSTVNLEGIVLGNKKYGSISAVDVRWGGVNLAVIDWSGVKVLGNEHQARQKKYDNGPFSGQSKDKLKRLSEYQEAVRAYRQLASALQDQGLDEVASRFAYRAQGLQRSVLWLEVQLGRTKLIDEYLKSMQEQETDIEISIMEDWLFRHEETIHQQLGPWQKAQELWQKLQKVTSYIFSWLLAILAGYGYKPARTIFWYLLVISSSAIAYSVVGHLPLWPDSLVFSVMSFHGRGFFPSLSGETSLHNPVVIWAAAEAVVGLLIEVSFIATFTQRFFGK